MISFALKTNVRQSVFFLLRDYTVFSRRTPVQHSEIGKKHARMTGRRTIIIFAAYAYMAEAGVFNRRRVRSRCPSDAQAVCPSGDVS